MYLTEISSNSALVLNQPIVFASTPTLATNDNVSLNEDNNGLIINYPGVYKVRFQANMVSSTTDVGASLYADGEEVTMTRIEIALAEGDSGEVVIEYPIEILPTEEDKKALLQFVSTNAGTILSGYVSAERII